MARAVIAVARIRSPYPEWPTMGLGTALVPGKPVDRFGRTWRLEMDRDIVVLLRKIEESELTRTDLPRMVRGRLGFDKTLGEAPAWDEKVERFVAQRQHDGDVVPFSIRLSDLSVAFQRTAKVKRQSFIGALQRLLREGSQDDRWQVDDRLTERNWEDFATQAAHVREVRLIVRPTNPGWNGQELFEPFITESGASQAIVTMTGEEIDLDSTPVQQAKMHAIDRGYGELSVKASTVDGLPLQFDSERAVPLLDEEAQVRRGERLDHQTIESALTEADELAGDSPSDASDAIESPNP